MKSKHCVIKVCLVACLFLALPTMAQDDHSHHHADLAEQATNPVAPLVQLQFQNNSVIESNAGDGYSNAFVVQPVIPWGIGKVNILSRITFPLLINTPDLPDPVGHEHGTGDTVALNFATFNVGKGTFWQGMIGPGLTFTIPTASSDFTGEGKYQAGPGFVYLNTGTKGLQWGVFFYQQWSFADGSNEDNRRNVSKFYIQPIITKHFSKGRYIALQDFLWTMDSKDNNRWSLPTGLRFGQVRALGKQKVNLFIEPWYDISGNNNGNEWGIKFNLTLLFPQ